MNKPTPTPPLIKRTAKIAESVAEVLAAIIMGGAGYYMMQEIDPTDKYSFLAPLIVGMAMGCFGSCSIFLTGPATMLGLIIWSPIDLFFLHAVDHPSWPSEMVWYGLMACVGLTGAAVGRATMPWCNKRT